MYEYRFRSMFSTKPASIYDEQGNEIGIILKKYDNLLQRVLDVALLSRYFENYEIKNKNGQTIFMARRDLSPFKIRQFYIDYYNGMEYSTVHLVDEDLLVTEKGGKKTTFTYQDETYELERRRFDSAKIKKNGTVIAIWDITFAKAYFKLNGNEYKNNIFLLIGIFHVYLRKQTF